MIIHSPIVSGSLTFANGATITLPVGSVYSGSFSGSYQGASFIGGTFSGNGSSLTFGGTGIVSGSSQLTTDFDARYLNTLGDGIVSSSAQVVSILTPLNTFSSSQETKNSTLATLSGSIQTKNDTLGTYTASLETKNSTLATYTGSVDTKNSTLETYTASLETKNSTLATYTASLETKNDTLGTYTASLETKNSTLATYTGSIDTLLSNLGTNNSSLGTYTASIDTKFVTLASYTGSVDTKNSTLETYTSSLETKNSTLATYTGSVDTKNNTLGTYTSSLETKNSTLASYTGSVDTKNDTLGTYTASLETKNSTLASYTGSIDSKFSNLATTSGSLLSSQTNLNTYTGSLLGAFQVTGSKVNFLGDITVYGTQSVINSTNVQIADNILYLSPTASVDNDLGIVGHYNDGTYQHAGIFMDASDGHTWKVFKGLTDETIGTVDTSGNGFTLADFKAGTITATSFNGIFNATNGLISGSSQVQLGSASGNIALATQTTGDYVASLVAGTNITLSNNSGENATPTIGLTNNAITIAGTSTSLGGSITLATITGASGIVSGSSQITHSSTTGYVANEHIDHTTVSVTAGSGLTGGGTIAATRTISIATSGVTNDMLAGSIANAKLANSTISGISLGSNLATLTIGTGLSGTSYNGSTGITIANTGVTSNVAGTGISVSGATGAVTITNTGVTSAVAGTGVGVSAGTGAVTISIGQAVATSSNVQFNSLGVGMAASATAGRIDATNDIVAYSSSDIRFKENITPIENALDKINQIGGYTYDWKEENKIEHGYDGNDVGVIAQEIEAVLPQLVQTRESGYKAVKYDKLVALLIQGIKEQQKQIDELKLQSCNCNK